MGGTDEPGFPGIRFAQDPPFMQFRRQRVIECIICAHPIAIIGGRGFAKEQTA